MQQLTEFIDKGELSELERQSERIKQKTHKETRKSPLISKRLEQDLKEECDCKNLLNLNYTLTELPNYRITELIFILNKGKKNGH